MIHQSIRECQDSIQLHKNGWFQKNLFTMSSKNIQIENSMHFSPKLFIDCWALHFFRIVVHIVNNF